MFLRNVCWFAILVSYISFTVLVYAEFTRVCNGKNDIRQRPIQGLKEDYFILVDLFSNDVPSFHLG
jgi:hypothetical protein